METTTTETVKTFKSLITGVRAELDKENSVRLTGELYATSLVEIIKHTLNISKEIAINGPLIEKQKEMIEKQIETEVEKKLLTQRQTKMYDDNLRVEEGKMLTQVVGMYGAGGTALPTGLETQMINAVAAITPS